MSKHQCLNKSPSGMFFCKAPQGHEGPHQEVVIMEWQKNKETHLKISAECECTECRATRKRQESAGL